MARLPYPAYEDKFFAAVGKPTINVLKLLSYSAGTIEQWSTIGNSELHAMASVVSVGSAASAHTPNTRENKRTSTKADMGWGSTRKRLQSSDRSKLVVIQLSDGVDRPARALGARC